MRIISGWARGRRLFTPPGRSQDIRPTSDRAREALFNILADRFPCGRVLDLCAGTGALGLEALSRGADEVIFVDLHRQALDLIQRNIAVLKPDMKRCSVSVVRHDLRKGLPRTLHEAKFDIIFLDPPYSQGLCLKILEYLSNGSFLGENSVIVAEDRSSESLPDSCGVLTLIDRRTYGDTGFWLYSPRNLTDISAEERK